jgi:hypothetical protein
MITAMLVNTSEAKLSSWCATAAFTAACGVSGQKEGRGGRGDALALAARGVKAGPLGIVSKQNQIRFEYPAATNLFCGGG